MNVPPPLSKVQQKMGHPPPDRRPGSIQNPIASSGSGGRRGVERRDWGMLGRGAQLALRLGSAAGASNDAE